MNTISVVNGAGLIFSIKFVDRTHAECYLWVCEFFVAIALFAHKEAGGCVFLEKDGRDKETMHESCDETRICCLGAG